MKKSIALLLALLVGTAPLAGCSSATVTDDTTVDTTSTETTETVRVVSTIFPIYDWMVNIVGEDADNIDLTMLVDTGVDLHSYQPTPDDIIEIYDCDLFIYVGGESDEWVDDILAQAEGVTAINLLELLGDDVVMEETVEGMQEEEHDHDDEEATDEDDHDHDDEEATDEDDHDHDDEEATDEATDEEDHDHDDEEETEEHSHEDEHVWLSLKNAQTLCTALADVLATFDTANDYTANAESYVQQLADLDAEYQEVVETATFDTILFADRFPFRYLVDDYNLTYYAAFSGCSTETDASLTTIIFLAEKLNELALPAILTIDGSDQSIAESVKSNTTTKGQTILMLDSMQSTTADDVENGVTYLSVMESNLAVLEQALN